MLVKFSDATASLLKIELPKIGSLFEIEDENNLNLANIKQLKGCRTGLIQDCLKLIQELDALAPIRFINTEEKENHLIESRKSLIEGLKKYLSSCERYPRTKDFLNIIPDNLSGMVSFTIIASIFTAILISPSYFIIPFGILIWVGIDLVFNNRGAVKNFREVIFTAEDELRTIKEASEIFNRCMQKTLETEETPLIEVPSTSRGYQTNSRSHHFYPVEVHRDDDSISSDSSSLTLS